MEADEATMKAIEPAIQWKPLPLAKNGPDKPIAGA
jgi:hypothetical protein